MARLLNVTAAPPRSVRPCKPEVQVFSWSDPSDQSDRADTVHVAFDPNSLCALQVDAETAERIAKGPDGFTGLLFSGVAPEFPPALPALSLVAGSERSESNGAPSIPLRKLVLNLTHACNLRCKYCFAADYDGAPSGAHGSAPVAGYRDRAAPLVGAPVMPVETAFKALSLFDSVAPKPPSSVPSVSSVVKTPLSVAFFGGEPLLAWPTLILTAERVYQLAYERKVPCSLHVTTNGTLLDPLKAAALKRFNFSVLLSLDGPREIHNDSRPLRSDPSDPSDRADSFSRVMAGLDALNAAGIIPSIRATFADSEPRLVERLEFFDALWRAGKISGVSIEPAILAEGCSSVPQVPMDLIRLEAEWHAAAEWFVARARAGKPFPFFYFRKLLARLLNCEFHGSECGAGRGYLTVGPDGKIFACHRESGTEIGALSGVAQPPSAAVAVFNNQARAPWLRNCIAEHPECAECWARYLCGGGCAQNRVEVGGAVTAPVPHVCAARKAMMKQVLWIAAQLTREEALKAAGMSAEEKGRSK